MRVCGLSGTVTGGPAVQHPSPTTLPHPLPTTVVPDTSVMDDPLAGRGLAAVRSVLASLGFGTPILEVRSARGSLWVGVPAAGLVARVSTHTGAQRRHPEQWLTRELRVAGRAADLGLPVMRPATDIDPGPYESDGLHLSFWEDLRPDGGEPSAEQVADLLIRLHRDVPLDGLDLPEIPALTIGVEDGMRSLERGGIDPAVLVALGDLHREALKTAGPQLERSPQVVLHGDAHPGNAVHAPFRGWTFIDLEETGRGPVEVDLAVLIGDGAGREAVRRYCAAAGRPMIADNELEPWRILRSVSATVWLIGCAVTFPTRYREAAIQATIETLDRLPPGGRPGRRAIADAVSDVGRRWEHADPGSLPRLG